MYKVRLPVCLPSHASSPLCLHPNRARYLGGSKRPLTSLKLVPSLHSRIPCSAGAPDHGSSLEKASRTASQCAQRFLDSNLNSLLEFVPDEVREACQIEKEMGPIGKLQDGELQFREVVELSRGAGFHFDSYAVRMVVNEVPKDIQVLSSMMLDENIFMQRWRVVGRNREEAVLTMKLGLHDIVIPAYRGVHMAKTWMLEAVKGEHPDVELNMVSPDPAWPPELVVQAQLEALRQGDVKGTYKFASSNIKAVFTAERFASMLQSEFYSPLLGHFQHRIKLSNMLENNVLKQLVSVQVEPGSCWHNYVWIVRRESTGKEAGCWMTLAVQELPE